jgi:hypothetical protein
MQDPQTPEQWQEAVDVAHVMSLVESAKQYGLITGPVVNVDRCHEILDRGAALGYTPAPDAVERLLSTGR